MANLILVPTPLELGLLRQSLEAHSTLDGRWGSDRWAVQLCGFGPIAAAARTGALISRYKPAQIVLVGIAGSFDVDRRPIGTAWQFSQVACYGIGVGTGKKHESASELGWNQFEGDDVQPTVSDRIDLIYGYPTARGDGGLLLTSPAASADEEDVRLRQEKFPIARAEDMEGFAVAASCLLAAVPLRIVRGISNVAGDRDKNRWAIGDAMASAGQLVQALLETE